MSFFTFTLIGAPFSFQSGINAVKALGSRTAPDRICAPTSEPFSKTTTSKSGSNCLILIAADNPAGPAPTITTSYGILSRSIWLIFPPKRSKVIIYFNYID